MEGINFSDCQINAFYVFEYSHVMIGITCTGWLQGLHWGWWGSKDNGWRHHECCTGKRSRMQGESCKDMLCFIFIKRGKLFARLGIASMKHSVISPRSITPWFHSMNAVTFRNLFFNWFMRLITAFIGHLHKLVLILHKRNSQCNVDLRIVMRMLISWTEYYTDSAVLFISDPAINLFWLLVLVGAGCYRDICWFPQGADISQPSPIYRSKSGWSCQNETTSYS